MFTINQPNGLHPSLVHANNDRAGCRGFSLGIENLKLGKCLDFVFFSMSFSVRCVIYTIIKSTLNNMSKKCHFKIQFSCILYKRAENSETRHTTIAYIDSIQYLALHVLPQLFCGHWAHLVQKQRPYPAFITQLKAVIHKVNIINMSFCDRNRVLSYTKALAFIICVGGFVWKLSDSYAAFISKDVGTKTNLKANYEENLPGLAVCRHPNQITTRWNGNISLEDKYNMTLTHLRVCAILLKSI